MKKIFFIITVICFLGGHALVFLAWRYHLNFNFQANLYLFFLILLFFILSTTAIPLIRFRDNAWTRLGYLLAALWGGVMLNSLLLFIFFWLVTNVLTIFNFYLNADLVSILFFILQGPLLLVEFLLAYFLRVRKITVKIKNLPASWEGKTIAHISDVHLGPIWRQQFFKKLLKKVHSLQADAICITGDLFDGVEIDFSWLNHLPNKFTAPLGVYYSFGNHDEDLGSDKVRELLAGGGIQLLENKLIEVEGLQIIGLVCGFARPLDVRETLLNKLGYDSHKPSILLFHEPRDLPAVQAAGISLQLSGHTHAGQMFPFNFANKALYNGHDFGVFNKQGLTLSVTSGAGTWGPPLRLGPPSEIVLVTLKKA